MVSMSRLPLGWGLAAVCLLGLSLCTSFVAPIGRAAGPSASVGRLAAPRGLASGADGVVEEVVASAWSSAIRFVAGAVLGAVLLGTAVGPARADIDDVAIPVDAKGKTTNLTKEQLVRGKRLFLAACSTCHVGGGTRTNQNVALSLEELSGALPARNTVESLVDYLNAPTSYDGLKDISEVHPSIKSADLFPKMRSMKQQDLYDISAYILYQNFTIPEKWGGGKQYY